MAHIKLYVFGPPRLECNGQPIELNLRRAQALLVYLAVSGKLQSRDALATLLWPESNQSESRARLRRTLHRLQHALDEALLDVNPETIRVQPAVDLWLDSAAFRQHVTVGLPAAPDAALAPKRLAHLEAAVALYNDDFLAGFTLPDSPAFDEWQFFQRESLRQLYGQVLEQLIAAHRAAEAWDAAIGYARRWVALDGLHESAQRTLMQLYAWAGQPAAAVRQYQECVRILDAELGTAPEEETTALYETIRTRQLGLPAAAARQSSRLPVPMEEAPHERYVPEELLATGGQGEVYRGHDRVTGQPVAIKRLKPDLMARHPDALARFVREGAILRQLQHPNIVGVVAAFEHADQYSIVTEYMPGGSLRTLLQRDPQLSLDRVLTIGLELADALSRAHHLGIIHRDLKPENVLLAADGTPRLTDFGMARLEQNDTALTQSGTIFGSPAYMSPEALRGEELDARTDIWSLGVLLYELLAGRRPFEGAQITPMLASILEDPVPDLERFRLDMSPLLGTLVQRMLVKERAQRLASMRQVAATLEAIRAGGTAENLLADQRGQAQASGASAPVVLRAPTTHAETDTLLEAQITTALGPIARQGVLLQYREERRWVTVLSADLPGFASLAERLDPEDLKALAHQCAERLAAEVHRFGGTVINILGNAMLAVFGAPVANEDDAERAVRAGLAIRDLALIRPGDPDERRIEVRVGINTGDVMAGLVGPEERRDYTVMGGAVNIAARLMSGAPAKAVVVGEETYRATRGRVRYREVPPVETSERARPVAAWEAIDAASMPWARPLRTTPLVGRDQELTLLLGIWTRVAREARPQLITVLGEPGIGKSRLLAEFERRAQALGQITLLHGRCLPYGEALGYRALSMALHEAAGVMPEDDPKMARLKLGALVASVIETPAVEGEQVAIARHLALLSGLDTAEDRSAVQVDEHILHASVRRFLEALARRRPLCVLIEDIHWADETLLNLLEFVAARAQGAPLLIVAQARPELLERRPTWGGGLRAFMSLQLEPLDQDAGLALARALCHERGLPEAVIERVGRVAGGNPLFVEELIATIAERPDEMGIPSAIKALIAARLDRLRSEERQIIACASVFGRHCWLGGLAALGVDGDVAEHLETLERHDLLRQQPQSRFRGDREYVFKHDLICDVAYEMLPRADRRRLHGQVADWIERTTGERADELLDLLAHHAVRAEQHERALGYLTRAAERARRAAAHREEAALLAQAIAIAERSRGGELIPELRARRGRAFASVALWADARRELETALAELGAPGQERRAEVLLDLALACSWSMDTPALRRHAGQALELAEAAGRADLAMDARFWLAWAAGSEGEVGSAVDQYQQVLARATALNVSPTPSVLPLYATTLCWAAQFDRATECAREAVQVARAANDTDATILGLQVQGLALAGTGRYDEAWRVFDEASRFGREFGIGPFLARSIAMSAGFHLDVFDFDGHTALAEEAREMARSVGFPPPLVSASIDLLLNLARRGEVARAEQLAGEVAGAVQKAVAWHGWLWRLRFSQAQAEIALARGAAEQAIVLAGEAFERSRRTRAKYQVLALVTRAQALGKLGRTREAVGDLRLAVQLARPQADPALFLRSVAALLELDGDDQLVAEARATAGRILARLPTEEMRERFRAAEPVRLIGRLVAPRDA
jgi:class 3 adenylate cyclase/DNA-binding SARP family transcriptional activator/tRNA A-37 threonylcarbamoyl transferase component Bud32